MYTIDPYICDCVRGQHTGCVVESYINETALLLYAYDEMPTSMCCESIRDIPVGLRKEWRKELRSRLVELRKKLRSELDSINSTNYD